MSINHNKIRHLEFISFYKEFLHYNENVVELLDINGNIVKVPIRNLINHDEDFLTSFACNSGRIKICNNFGFVIKLSEANSLFIIANDIINNTKNFYNTQDTNKFLKSLSVFVTGTKNNVYDFLSLMQEYNTSSKLVKLKFELEFDKHYIVEIYKNYIIKQEYNTYGIVDENNKEIIPCIYNRAEVISKLDKHIRAIKIKNIFNI